MIADQPQTALATVRVTGRGRAGVVPDVAVLDLAYEATAEHPEGALTAASAALGRARRVLTDHGVGLDDVRSTELALWPDHDQAGQPSGYRAVLGLTVRTRDLDAVGRLVQAAVAAGESSSRLRGLQLLVADPAAAQDRARDAAWADAHRAATRLAALAGRSLGLALQVRDGAPADPTGPSVRFAMDEGASSPALAAGQLEVEQVLTVTWGLA